MSLIALSVNHHSADVKLREQVAFNPERAGAWLHQLYQQGLRDIVLLSTCNRTEIYAHTTDIQKENQIIALFADTCHVDHHQLRSHLYRHHDQSAITHLIRVASGLDSQVLGEPQILGQIKQALHIAEDQQMLSARFKQYFDFAFFGAKKVRTETAVGEHAVSLGYAVSQLATQVFADMSRLNALIVATGEMNSLVAKHLAERGIGRLTLCNRTRERAAQLAADLPQSIQVTIIDFDQLDSALAQADIVSSCTASLHQIIGYDAVKTALMQRRYQPMLMVDLAVPRDIAPEIDSLDGVYLYGIDDLQRVIDDNLSHRREAAAIAETMVAELVKQFAMQQKIQQAGSSIEHYRQHADHFRHQEMQHALQQLKQGLDAEQVLEQLSKRLTNKLLHVPSRLLREAATADDPSHYHWLQQTIQDIHVGTRAHTVKSDDSGLG